MFEFERNIAYQQEIFASAAGDDDVGEVALEAEPALPDKTYEILVIDEHHYTRRR